ncbi:hypothetical protein JOE21_003490 [Desmospora profundinema]|uniref:Uncharacterized protein n=1 Tax=Desmospora profundinema TaxID=1571184 RepID=A0ABU1IRV2_9BACL|nr:hypothetical protein [Desmospora profundinema]
MSADQIADFVYLRPAFYLIAFLSLLNLCYLLFFYKRWRSDSYILINSLFIFLITCVLFFQSGVIVDEIGSSGDPVYFYLTVSIFIISIISSIVYFRKK